MRASKTSAGNGHQKRTRTSPISPSVGPISPMPSSSPSPASENVATQTHDKNAGPIAVPSPGGDLSRLGSGERNMGEAIGRLATERAGASESTQDEDEQSSAEGANPNPKSKIKNHQSPSSPLDDSLSRIYAALSPAPELLAERNRRHEELRRQAEANRQARLIQSQLSAQSSSPLDSFSEPAYPHAPKPSQPGFSPPPTVPFPVHSIFGEIHHPSDNRRCHTS